jgi:uncharacterized membrane-anchored protein
MATNDAAPIRPILSRRFRADQRHIRGTGIFSVAFAIAVAAQIRAARFSPGLYWTAIIASTTVGTTLADYADRSLGIGYTGGSAILLSLLVASLFVR